MSRPEFPPGGESPAAGESRNPRVPRTGGGGARPTGFDPGAPTGEEEAPLGLETIDIADTLPSFNTGRKVFNRYTLQRVLGRGGMGIVWLAWDEALAREVALKFLPDIVAYNPGAVDELKRETRRSLQLTHPNILRIYDFVQDESNAAISMEYVDGDTLAKLRVGQTSGVFEADGLKVWMRQLCVALDYAHQKAKVVHRDLKPANLMINREGELKIADFGIARSICDSVSRATQTSSRTSGTLAYMSPQQLDGDQPSMADDIYSLGATLYELFTGKPPFYSGDISIQVRTKLAPSMTVRRSELSVEGAGQIPEEWEATVAACLSKDPAHRPASAGEVAETLGLAEAVGAAPRPTPAPGAKEPRSPTTRKTKKVPPAPPAQRPPDAEDGTTPGRGVKRGALILVGLLAVGLLSYGGWKWVAGHRAATAAPAQPTNAVAPPLATTNGPVVAAVPGGEVVAATKPSGAQVTLGSEGPQRSPARFSALKPGQYPLRIELESYEPFIEQVEVLSGRTNDLGTIALVRSTGSLQLRAPSGVTYEVINGRGEVPAKSGRTPERLADLPTGLYTVRFRQPGRPDEERQVQIQRGEEAIVELTVTASSPSAQTPSQAVSPPVVSQPQVPLPAQAVTSTIGGPTKDGWTNSLGMGFLPVPAPGKEIVLFSKWETRVKDFEAFIKETGPATGKDRWQNPSDMREPECPAVNVRWQQATSFCAWLTNKERQERRLGAHQAYRLPTDEEWSRAVGLGSEPGASPRQKNHANRRDYPWGTVFPPGDADGNYAGIEYQQVPGRSGLPVVKGHRDAFPSLAPVGKFKPNRYGLYDLGGNAAEWCQDLFDPPKPARVVRGAAWDEAEPEHLLSSYRNDLSPGITQPTVGFRCVLSWLEPKP